jgi:hypothetical protein
MSSCVRRPRTGGSLQGPGPVIHAHAHLSGQLAVKAKEVKHVPAERLDNDHRRGATAHVNQVQGPAANVNHPARRRIPFPVNGLSESLVSSARHGGRAERDRTQRKPPLRWTLSGHPAHLNS